MSEVTTLKQLMLDAARYRWLRENMCDFIESWNFAHDPAVIDSSVDASIDKELALEGN